MIYPLRYLCWNDQRFFLSISSAFNAIPIAQRWELTPICLYGPLQASIRDNHQRLASEVGGWLLEYGTKDQEQEAAAWYTNARS